MKKVVKFLFIAILLLVLASICKTAYFLFNTAYLLSNYVVLKNVIKLGNVTNDSANVSFVCPEGANFNLLLGFTNTDSCMNLMQSDSYGNIMLSDKMKTVLHDSYYTEYCNWLNSEKLKSVIIKPKQHHVSSLDQYLTPGKMYFLIISSPNPEKELSLWLHFEKKLKAQKGRN